MLNIRCFGFPESSNYIINVAFKQGFLRVPVSDSGISKVLFLNITTTTTKNWPLVRELGESIIIKEID